MKRGRSIFQRPLFIALAFFSVKNNPPAVEPREDCWSLEQTGQIRNHIGLLTRTEIANVEVLDPAITRFLVDVLLDDAHRLVNRRKLLRLDRVFGPLCHGGRPSGFLHHRVRCSVCHGVL